MMCDALNHSQKGRVAQSYFGFALLIYMFPHARAKEVVES